MKIHNDFIGLNDTNVNLPFLPGDSQELYHKNLIDAHVDWYYRNVSIDYYINRNGHRSKNINDLDLSNYILFAGCSHTTGIGLELEKTYPYILSDNLKCDYYNLSMPGAGIDVMEYNLLMWFAKISQRPKLVIIQMPDHSRYAGYNPYISSDFFMEKGSWDRDSDELKMVVNCEDVGFFHARKYLVYKNIEHVIDVPIIKFNVYGQNNENNDLKIRKLDLARDLSHLGILSNKSFSTTITDHIITNYGNLFS